MVKTRQIELQDRDIDVLKHIARYRMTVEGALEKMPFFRSATRDAVKGVLRRLREAGYIESAQLYQRKCYYYLTKRAANVLGNHEYVAGPLSDDPKIRCYAALSFCCLQEPRRTKLTAAEFRERFSQIYSRGDRIDYYIDTEGATPRLGYIRVDMGKSGRWDHLLSTLHRFVSRKCDNEHFRELILDGGFTITILTAIEQKAQRLQEAFEDADFPEALELKCRVVPDLLALIAPSPR